MAKAKSVKAIEKEHAEFSAAQWAKDIETARSAAFGILYHSDANHWPDGSAEAAQKRNAAARVLSQAESFECFRFRGDDALHEAFELGRLCGELRTVDESMDIRIQNGIEKLRTQVAEKTLATNGPLIDKGARVIRRAETARQTKARRNRARESKIKTTVSKFLNSNSHNSLSYARNMAARELSISVRTVIRHTKKIAE